MSDNAFLPPIRIERWAVKPARGSDFSAPEVRGIRLRGDVFGHPRHPDGNRVSTGPIVKVEGRTVTTESGSVYVLGAPDPRYLEWLAEEGIAFNPEKPIVVKGGPS